MTLHLPRCESGRSRDAIATHTAVASQRLRVGQTVGAVYDRALATAALISQLVMALRTWICSLMARMKALSKSVSEWPRQRLTLIALSAATAIVCTLSVYGIMSAAQFWRELPIADQWEAVRNFRSWTTGALSFSDIISPHNEHRIPLTRLAFLTDFIFFQGRSRFIYPLVLLAHIGLGAAIGLVATRGLRPNEQVFGAATGVTFFVAPSQIENLTRPFNLPWPVCGLFALGALFWTAHVAKLHTGHPTSRKQQVLATLGLAVASMVLAVYTLADGLVVAPIVAAMALMLPIGFGARITLTITAALSVASYFLGYPFMNAGFYASFQGWDEILKFVAFIAAFLGAITHGSLEAAVFRGIIGLVIWATLMFALFLQLRSKRVDSSTITLVMLATVAVAVGVLIAFGRAGLGPQQGMQLRYATWPTLFWVCLAASGWRLAKGAGHTVPGVITLGVIGLLLYLSYLPTEAKRLEIKTARIDAIASELRAGTIVPEHLVEVYPLPDRIIPLIEFLRAYRASIFAD
jgi:hypothetical protein